MRILRRVVLILLMVMVNIACSSQTETTKELDKKDIVDNFLNIYNAKSPYEVEKALYDINKYRYQELEKANQLTEKDLKVKENLYLKIYGTSFFKKDYESIFDNSHMDFLIAFKVNDSNYDLANSKELDTKNQDYANCIVIQGVNNNSTYSTTTYKFNLGMFMDYYNKPVEDINRLKIFSNKLTKDDLKNLVVNDDKSDKFTLNGSFSASIMRKSISCVIDEEIEYNLEVRQNDKDGLISLSVILEPKKDESLQCPETIEFNYIVEQGN
ncbi:hypothetical protein LJB88_00490 [Erysipelotrichaceae bacterium OttesenSCG-928-M19]|nr:hypothetical protein [Erysipelotrichaceae bacterium OttesenSCG-928-M19]